uniref:Peptidase M16C associated domain-containing protein n=1 Tax=Zooxanthella nutricula TaxID=1333877 RepID=A0A7S2LLQ8_9DINO
MDVLREQAEEAGKFDLERIRSLISLESRQYVQRFEASPHDSFLDPILSEFLFGPAFAREAPETSGESLLKSYDKPAIFEALSHKPAEYWTALLKSEFVEKPRATLVGIPSKKTSDQLQSEETARVEAQRQALASAEPTLDSKTIIAGASSALPEDHARTKLQATKWVHSSEFKSLLDQHAFEVEVAEAANGMDAPESVLKSIQQPDMKNIQLISKETANIHTNPNAKIQIDMVGQAQMVDIRLLYQVDFEKVPLDTLQTLPLFVELAFELPLRKSRLGAAMTAQETVTKCTNLFNTKSCSFSVGMRGRFGLGFFGTNALVFVAKVEKARAEEALAFLCRIKEDSQFTEEKLKTGVNRLLNAIPEQKRDGQALCATGFSALAYREMEVGTNGEKKLLPPPQKFFSWPWLNAYLTNIKNAASSSAAFTDVLNALNGLTAQITQLAVQIGGDLADRDRLHALFANSSDLFEGHTAVTCWRTFALEQATILQPEDVKGSTTIRGVMIPCASIESNFLRISMRTDILDFKHPDYVALVTATECFTMLEASFWRKIRGRGLAYGYGLSLSPMNGLLEFYLSKTANPVEAWEEAKKIIDDYTNTLFGGSPDVVDETIALNAAKSGLVFGLVSEVESVPDVLTSSFFDLMARKPKDHFQQFTKTLEQVTPAAVRRVTEKYILPLFASRPGDVKSDADALAGIQSHPVLSLACPANQSEATGKALRDAGFKVLELSVEQLETVGADLQGWPKLQDQVRRC